MDKELDFVKEMFDSIAPKYDFLNRFLSLRQDVMWRKEMVRAASLPQERFLVLDVACGTCDVALEVTRQRGERGNEGTVIATDFSPGMLMLGKRKVEAVVEMSSGSSSSQLSTHLPRRPSKGASFELKKPGNTNIHLTAGNALCLPFKKGLFDAVFIAFGIRNIMDRQGALEVFHSMLKPGGRVVVLELTSPPKGIFRDLYMLYFQRILPMIGGLFSKNDGAYHYLPASVLKFPTPKAFARLMMDAGFESVKWRGMTLGIVTLFVGQRVR